MADTVKNFFNSTVAEASASNLVNNDASTQALVKNIKVCNTTGAANTFDVDLDGVKQFSQVPIANNETVLLENVNSLVDVSKALTLTNNAPVFAKAINVNTGINVVFVAIKQLSNGDIFVVYYNQSASNQLYYAVYDSAGVEIQASTLVAATTSNYLSITESSTNVNIGWYNGNGFPQETYISKFTYTSPTTRQIAAAAHYSNRIESFGVDSTAIAYFTQYSSGNVPYYYIGYAGSGTLAPLPAGTGHNTNSPSLALLSDGNMLFNWRNASSNGDGWFVSYQSNGTIAVAATKWFTGSANSGVNIISTKGLSNGTFAVLYHDQVDSSLRKIALFSNTDFSAVGSPITITGGTTINFYAYGDVSLQVDANDNVYVIYYDSSTGAPYPYKVNKYTSTLTTVYEGKVLSASDIPTSPTPSFDIDSATSDILSMYEVAGEAFVTKQVADSSLSVSCDGVEIV